MMALLAGRFGRIFPPAGMIAATRKIHLATRTLIWLPLATGVVWACVFAFSQQTAHVYLSFIETSDWARGGLGLIVVLALCLLIYAWHSQLGTARMDEVYRDHADPDLDRRLAAIRDLKATFSGMLPLLGVDIGLARLYFETASVEDIVTQADHVHAAAVGQPAIPPGAVQAVSLNVLAACGGVVALTLVCICLLTTLRRPVGSMLRQLAVKIGLAIGVVVALAPFLLKSNTVGIAIWLGPLATTGLVMLAGTMALIPLSRRPLLILLPAGVLAATATGFRISDLPGLGTLVETRPITGCGGGDCTKPSLTGYFDAWLSARRSPNEKSAPYPVFIVAVEGGGIYAASAAAKLLSTLQDHCPHFARHVFIISGVSGGAIGASIFNALNAERQTRDLLKRCDDPALIPAPFLTGMLSHRAGQVVSADHLSGPVAFIIPDSLRKFDMGLLDFVAGQILQTAAWAQAVVSPNGRLECLPAQARFDRARALEYGFTTAFARVATNSGQPNATDGVSTPCDGSSKTGLAVGYDRHTGPAADAPGLVLNTTWVERGYRVTFAPFRMRASGALTGDGTLYDFADLGRWLTKAEGHEPISLIEAAVASARFPGLMPAATVDFVPAQQTRPRGNRWNFVDGGYADGSGATTAHDIFISLERHIKRQMIPVELRLILLTDAETGLNLPDIEGNGFKDTLVVVRAILNVRELLAQRAVTAALNSEAAGKIMVLRLVDEDLPLPLGWRISRRMDNVVEYLLGDAAYSAAGCSAAITAGAADPPNRYERIAATVRSNSCVQRQILELLASSRS